MVKKSICRTWISSAEGAVWKEKRPAAPGRAYGNLSLSPQRGRKWLGMGGAFNELGWQALSSLPAVRRRKVIAALFDPADGCRFNFCRIPIGASDYAGEWYSLAPVEDDFEMKHFSIERDRRTLIPYVKAALKIRPDLRFFASPWSPPVWMKDHKAYNVGSPRREPKYQRALALYYVRFLEAYAREGIRVDQIHVMNEPASTHHKFPMCEWTGAGMRDFIRDYLGPLFEERGVGAEIWLSTLNTSDYNGFVNTALSDPRARKYIAGVGLQWEGRFMLRRIHEAWPQMPLMQTENECGDGENTWEYAQYVFDMMYEYINGGVSAYIYWNMVLPEGGESTWGWKQNSLVTVDLRRGRVTYTPEFYLLKHLCAFVEPGAVRVVLAGEWAGTAIGFENPGGEIVLLVNNPFDRARTCRVEAAGGAFTAALPARSFNTFVVGEGAG